MYIHLHVYICVQTPVLFRIRFSTKADARGRFSTTRQPLFYNTPGVTDATTKKRRKKSRQGGTLESVVE
jgi:hypothetical protein